MLYPYQYRKSAPARPRSKSLPISLGLMGAGLFILIWVAWPIISFTFTSELLFGQIISPIGGSGKAYADSSKQPLAILGANTTSKEKTTKTDVDLTNVNAWFPLAPQKKVVTPVNSYQLSIPKLRIEDALVLIGENDLDKSLVHYGGTGLPGDYGTTVIFGHSTLPQFYNPKDYYSIFSLLPTLGIGDDIWVTYDKIRYRYVVEEMIVTEPTDLSPLTQRFDDSYLTLITCVPPGTYWKRLNVRAKLVRI